MSHNCRPFSSGRWQLWHSLAHDGARPWLGRARGRCHGSRIGHQPGQPSGPPDVVLVNGAVLTVDARDSVAEAVAITGGRITAVGTTAVVKALAGPSTQVIDLAGRAVTPA